MNKKLNVVIHEFKEEKNSEYEEKLSEVPKKYIEQYEISQLKKTMRKHLTWEAVTKRFIKMKIGLYGYKLTIMGGYGGY